jgi:hypothetical protein
VKRHASFLKEFLPTCYCICFGYAEFFSRSDHAVIRVFDEARDTIETHEQAGERNLYAVAQNT